MFNLTISAWLRFIAVIYCIFMLAATPLQASSLYYDDGSTSDLVSTIFSNDVVADSQQNGYGCAGCHGPAEAASCTANGTAGVQSSFLTYVGVRNCISRIINKVGTTGPFSAGPLPTIFNERMPQGGPYLTIAHRNLLSSWNTNGTPLGPPTASTTSSAATGTTAQRQTRRRLNGSFNPNTLGSGGTYGFLYGTSASNPTTPSSTVNTTHLAPAVARNRTITGLVCGTTYYYRARVTNGAATVLGSILNFNILCTAPIITGATTAAMLEDGLFTPPNLSVSDDDVGNLNWTIAPIANGAGSNGTATASGSGNSEVINYTPNTNYVGTDTFTVRVTNATTLVFSDHAITVTISEVNDPPEIDQGDAALTVVMDEDNSPLSFSLSLSAIDSDDLGVGDLTWAISSPAGDGTASVTSSGTSGVSKAINYTPDLNYNGGDSFFVSVTARGLTDTIEIRPAITPRNDPPVISALGIQTGIEGATVIITPEDNDPDTVNNGTNIVWNIVSGTQPGMSMSSTGVITWNVPAGTQAPPAVDIDYPVTISADDGGADHGLANPASSESFTIRVSPPDGDGDGFADYNDYCPNDFSATNLDTVDGDGTRGFDTDPNDLIGGDDCDLDDDNDGMLDQWEMDNFFDPFDDTDAAGDADGDGLTNLQEHDAMSNPRFGDLTIDATGYKTPHTLTPPTPTSVHPAATSVTASDYGPYRPGSHTIVWTASNSTAGALNTSDQVFNVRPLINFSANQQGVEGGTVNVNLTLNGEAPNYPVTVTYAISGTASAADYSTPTPASGAVVFTDSMPQSISFNLTAGDGTDANETVVFTLNSASNAVIGSKSTHTVTIIEGNVAPTAKLQFTQGMVLSSVYAADGAVTIDALATDMNPGQTLSYNWAGSDAALYTTLPTTNSFTTPALPVGNYLVDVTVTDNGSPQGSIRVKRILSVIAGDAVTAIAALGAIDSDGDGTNDDVEGLADSDGDGIPDYLDGQDGNMGATNFIADQVEDFSGSFVLETESGLTLSIGSTAQAANNGTDTFGALITNDQIASFGSSTGGASIYPADSFGHYGGIYDFSISGLIPGNSASVVIPLQGGIPRDAMYRKYHSSTGWNDFREDNNNLIASATGEPGACPSPGSSKYRSGLNYLDNCLQLTIQDGGPNDTDGSENGSIADPGTIAVALTEPVVPVVEEGGGRFTPWLLFMLMIFGGYGLWRQTGAVKNRSI